MKHFIYLLFVSSIMASLSGCLKKEKIGGGTKSILAGKTRAKAVYGMRSGKELGFVIITNIHGEGTRASAGSSWTGMIKPVTGPTVTYEGTTSGITINDTRYEFTDGRVFLAKSTAGTVSVQQSSIPVGSAQYDEEIDSIAKRPEIEKFLAPDLTEKLPREFIVPSRWFHR